MKRVLLVLLTLIATYNAYTQCTPDVNLNHSGVYPNPLPDGKAGVAYSQTITFQFPSDTTIMFAGNPTQIHVDTLVLSSINGFPASFTKTCNVATCKYTNSPLRGCVQVTGTPTLADTGTRKIQVSIIAKFKLGAAPISYPITDSSGTFRVQGWNTGLSRGQVPTYTFGIDQITPNPFTDKTVVTISSPKTEKATLAIRDILGKEVYTMEVNCKPGTNNFTIDTEVLKAGYYLLSVTSSAGVITKKITKR